MSQPVAVRTRYMQELNAAAVLAAVRADSPTSVSGLAQTTGLSRQAVTRSLNLLEQSGMVELLEPDRSRPSSGRPAQQVRFRAELGTVMGIEVSPGQARSVAADLAGETIGASTVTIDRTLDPASALIRAVEETLAAAGIAADDIWNATIAVSGIVDPTSGRVVLVPSMPEAGGDALIRAASQVLSCPVSIDNDVKLATQGERWRGASRDESTFVFIDWGERIGAGIVIGGDLFRGAGNDAGDIGYLDLIAPTQGLDRPDLGEFERWAGSAALLDMVDGGMAGSLDDVRAAIVVGDVAATRALHEIAARFAKGVNAIRALLDPEVIVVGGDMAIFGDALLEALTASLAGERLAQPRIELSRLGADAVVQGALHQALGTAERERLTVLAS
jgi:predicted NBD/HSP70 family sugar kinase